MIKDLTKLRKNVCKLKQTRQKEKKTKSERDESIKTDVFTLELIKRKRH